MNTKTNEYASPRRSISFAKDARRGSNTRSPDRYGIGASRQLENSKGELNQAQVGNIIRNLYSSNDMNVSQNSYVKRKGAAFGGY